MAGYVIVDRAGNADAGNPVAAEIRSASEGAVASDGNDPVDAELTADADRLEYSRLFLEFGAPCGIKDRSALFDYVCHIVGSELLYVALDETLVALVYSVNLNTALYRVPRNGADAGILARCVSSGGQYSYFSELLGHICLLLFLPRILLLLPT